MSKSTKRTEDWNQSMVKCEEISKLMPMLADSIKQIRGLDYTFERNNHLKEAEQLFRPLCHSKHLNTMEEKMTYVDEYRECLIHGIEEITHFFDELKNELKLISKEKQGEFGRLSAEIFMTQESIINIATH